MLQLYPLPLVVSLQLALKPTKCPHLKLTEDSNKNYECAYAMLVQNWAKRHSL